MEPAQRAKQLLDEISDPDVCAAEVLCDRHPADAVALTLMGSDMTQVDVTFGDLAARARRVAAALREMGVRPGDRVATLMGKSVDLVAVMLGTWRLGAVYVPLFTAFAPQAIAMRLEGSGAKVVIVDAAQRPKLDPGPDMPAGGGWKIVVADGPGAPLEAGPADADVDRVASGGGGPFVHMFTSGTTGKPKGVVHPLTYVAGWEVYLEYSLYVAEDDVYWCAADPGWAYGLYAAVIAPLAMGRRTILYAGQFDAATTWEVMTTLGVTNFAAAPTVYRALRAGAPPSDLRLRRVSSAGEPLTPEVNEWARDALGIEVHDHFGQTEVGMVLANHHHPAVAGRLKEGSMGGALPGWELTVLERDEDQRAGTETLGRLAIDVDASSLMTFEGYESAEGQTGKLTDDGRWYLLGDAARVDADGDYFFSARDDDVIIMAGYRIGPFEIESVLSQHVAVAECAVIGAPDPARGEVLEAYVVLKPGFEESGDLVGGLQTWVKERYAAHAYPRAVHFVPSLPKTPSGKIQRAQLRRRRALELTPATS